MALCFVIFHRPAEFYMCLSPFNISFYLNKSASSGRHLFLILSGRFYTKGNGGALFRCNILMNALLSLESCAMLSYILFIKSDFFSLGSSVQP